MSNQTTNQEQSITIQCPYAYAEDVAPDEGWGAPYTHYECQKFDTEALQFCQLNQRCCPSSRVRAEAAINASQPKSITSATDESLVIDNAAEAKEETTDSITPPRVDTRRVPGHLRHVLGEAKEKGHD